MLAIMPKGLRRLGGDPLRYAAVVGLALTLRLISLGDKPFHHDESQHAYFAWIFATGGGYEYTPLLHGPVRDFTTALMFLVFGVGDFTARLAPALLGTAIVALPYFLRRQLGSTAALASSVLLCISPTFLYFSRFQREDIYVACLTLALTAAVFRFLAHPKRWHPSLILGLLAASFATKETTYITVFVAGTFFVSVVAWESWQRRGSSREAREPGVVDAIRSVGLDAWISGLATFLVVFTVLFTTFFSHPQGLQDGLVESLRYWLGQQPVGRGGQPWFYYFVLLSAYEWLAVVLGAVGVAVTLRRPSLLRVYLLWAFVCSLVIYTWAGEKMPWLLMHSLLPLVLLAGIGFQALLRLRSRLTAAVGLAAAACTLWAATAVTFDHPADPAELLVFTQSAPEVPRAYAELERLDRRVVEATGRHLRVDFDRWSGMDWPGAWYLRDFRTIALVEMANPDYRPTADALIVSDPNRRALLPHLKKFKGYRFHHRVWWVPDYSGLGVDEAAEWLVRRRPWNPRGSLDQWLYVRRDMPGAALVAWESS